MGNKISIQAAAEILGVSVVTVYALIKRGALTLYKVSLGNRRNFLDEAEVKRFATDSRTPKAVKPRVE
jgi:excisionase family DNA binding protein